MERTDGAYDTDWELYDEFYAEVDDVDFYIGLAKRTGGPVLDAMCGTGRVLVPLARAGFEVVGVDANERMLDRARRKLEREPPGVRRNVSLVRADVRDFDLGRKARLAVVAFSSINHLIDPADADRAMASIKRHLAGDGLLAVATFIPHLEKLHPESLDRDIELEGGERLIRYSTTEVEEATGLLAVKYRWEVERDGKLVKEWQSSFRLRLLRPNQLKALLEGAGFEMAERWGGYRGEPLTPGGDIAVLVARPRMVWRENAKLLAP